MILAIELRQRLAQKPQALAQNVLARAVAQACATGKLKAAGRYQQHSPLGQQALAELLVILGNVQLDKRGGHTLRGRPGDTVLCVDPSLCDIAIAKHDLAIALEDLVLVLEHIGRQGIVEHAAANHGVIAIGTDAVGHLFVGHDPAHAGRRRRIGLGHRVGDDGFLVHIGHRQNSSVFSSGRYTSSHST